MMRGRKLRRFVALVAVATVAMIAGLETAEQETTEEELLRLNRELFESAILRKDATRLRTVALDSLVVIAPGGVVESKSQALAGVRAFDVTALSIDDTRVIVEGGTAIVVGKLTLTGQIRPIGQVGPLKFMSVFIRHESTWRLLARSLTPCVQAAISAGRC